MELKRREVATTEGNQNEKPERNVKRQNPKKERDRRWQETGIHMRVKNSMGQKRMEKKQRNAWTINLKKK